MTTTISAMDAGEYEYYGVRWVEDDLAIGATAPVSRVWVDGDPTDEVLDGACAVQVRTAQDIEHALAGGSYMGKPVLLGCNRMSYGEDAGEIVMEDAIVLALVS